MTIHKFLKITAAATTMLVLATRPALAESPRTEAAGVGGGALVGALAGGPVGLIIGAAVGGHYSATRHQADQVPALTAALSGSEKMALGQRQQIDALAGELDRRAGEITRLSADLGTLESERAALVALRLDLLYTTDSDQLSAAAAPQVTALVGVLHEMPGMIIVLEGHADRRGTEDYNAALALRRAWSVRDALVAGGVSSDRIVVRSLGENGATSPAGDLDAYAMDRRVSVSLRRGASQTPPAVASNR